MTMEELLNEWLYKNHIFNVKARTLLRYECAIQQHILLEYKDVDIDSITARDLQTWVNGLRTTISPKTNKPLSPSSINTIITILKLAYGYANDYDITKNNPTIRLKRINIPAEGSLKAFTRAEQVKIEHFIDSLNNDEYYGIILTLYTGLRLGELLALSWKDINLKTGVIYVNKTKYKLRDSTGHWIDYIGPPKTKSSIREIPIPTFVRDKLKTIKKASNSTYVIARCDGSPIDEKLYIYRYHRVLLKANVRDLNYHCLRHTFATRALENHLDIKTISEILGHSNVATTLNIYVHSLMNYKKTQMNKFKRLI